MSAPPPGGIASRPATPQPGGTAPIARPDGVTSALRSGRDAVAVAGVQARVALLQRELRGWPRRRARSRWRRRGCAGARCERSPVRSITPITAPVSGSWIGAALHVQRCTGSLKCSGPKTWTAWSTRERGADRVRARAGLAPQRALGEVHVAGRAQAHAARCPRSSSACRRRRRPRSGSRPRRRSPTGTRGSAGRRRASGCSSQRSCVSSSSATTGAWRPPVGSTPADCERRHESVIASRTSSGSSSSSAMNRSQAKRSSCARTIGVVSPSTASHEFGLTSLRLHAIRRIVEVVDAVLTVVQGTLIDRERFLRASARSSRVCAG